MAVCSVLLFWLFHGVFLVCVCSQSSLGLLIDHPLRDSQALTFLIPVSCPLHGWFKLYTQILWARLCYEAAFYPHVYVKARHKDTYICNASTPHCTCIYQNSALSSVISLQNISFCCNLASSSWSTSPLWLCHCAYSIYSEQMPPSLHGIGIQCIRKRYCNKLL